MSLQPAADDDATADSTTDSGVDSTARSAAPDAAVPGAVVPGAGAPTLLDVQDLSVRYRVRRGSVEAVRAVTLNVRAGETVAVVGESGSGKSTTAHAVLGLLPEAARLTAGRIVFDGLDLTGIGERRRRALRGREIALIPQDPGTALNPVHRVGRQVAEALTVHRLADRRGARAAALDLLADAGVPEPRWRAEQYPHELSGGLRQRVLIAIAMAARPRLIVADEPTSALDVIVQRQILDHIESMTRASGTGMLLITHDLGVAAERADRIVVMSGGEVVEQGLPEQIVGDPRHPYTRALVSAAPSFATARRAAAPASTASSPGRREPAAAGPYAATEEPYAGAGEPHAGEPHVPAVEARARTAQPSTPAGETPARAGKPHAPAAKPFARVSETRPREEDPHARPGDAPAQAPSARPGDAPAQAPSARPEDAPAQAPHARVEHLVKEYRLPHSGKKLRAVDDVSFDVPRGRTFALVGESGSGKSTVARLLLRLAEPTAGRVYVDGQDITEQHGGDLRRFRRRAQLVYQNPYESLNPKMTVSQIVRDPLAAHGVGSRQERRERAAELVELVALPGSVLERRPAELSGGQRQRVAIARALALEPGLLVCDEPVSALDVSVQAQILDLLAGLQERLGLSYLFISHDLAVVRQIAHEVGVMRKGRLVESGPADRILGCPDHPYTQALLAAIPGHGPTASSAARS